MMQVDEVTPVLDVHPPHEPIHGWRDFLLHLATITIGLLIALSLEGLVEWRHHRHLVHEAEAGLRQEIAGNEGKLGSVLDDLHKQQDTLKQNVVILKKIIADPNIEPHGLSIGFHIVSFDNVSWKTAQNTGALAFIPFSLVQEYGEIYDFQQKLDVAQDIGVRDAVLGVGMFSNPEFADPKLRTEQNKARIAKMENLQGQLLFLESMVKGLDIAYKDFLKAHPE